MAGNGCPGVDQAGVDSVTWSNHTDVRPTTLTLLGLKDDYSHEGRALVEKFVGWAQPSAVKKSANFVALAQSLKQINAAVGPFGLATLHASTVAMASGNTQDDSTYTSIESQLASFTTQRDALVAQILPLLEAARNQPHSAGAKPAVQCAILRGQLVTTNSLISREKLGEEK